MGRSLGRCLGDLGWALEANLCPENRNRHYGKSTPKQRRNRSQIGSKIDSKSARNWCQNGRKSIPNRPQTGSKSVLGGVWGGLGAIFGGLGGSRAVLGGSRGVLGSSWSRPGPAWAVLGPSWAVLEPPGGSPGPPGEDFGVHFSSFSGLGLQAVWGSSFIRILSGFLSVLGE